ncbi:hypothetical protein LWI29_024248 [Acer saccharum]|uniref:Retrovirus-related Pol polyprotein from transposon TNT 1-94-like beta-barrel domain-containing protein n=1 Tax=Acer saccharum TaxID=4024 RepID=A0AA39VH30_ACESA|nr:hypothetical protein LWI29_024248 [Acer saccharum]
MAATWSGSSDDSIEGDESSDDEELMANLLAFASSHKSKSASEREEMSQEENDSSEEESDSSSNSINGFVKKKVLAKYHAEFNDLAIKSTRKIKMLREENLELASHNDHLSEQVEKFKKMEDKLREELVLSRRNEDSLKREFEEVRESMTRMDSSTYMLGVGKSPCDKRGLVYENGKKISTSNKTVFVKSLRNEETSFVQIPRKKLEIGQSSNAQVKMGPRRQPQAQPPRVPQANIPPQLAHKGKRPIMQSQVRKQSRPVQQRRRIEPIHPQRQGQDSGCSRHMTGNKSFFETLVMEVGGYVTFSDGSKKKVVGK